MDGYLRELQKSTRSLEEARVVEDDEGDWYELEDGTIHVHVELSRGGERVYADLAMALGGSSAGMVRLPKTGDTCLVAIPGEGVGRAHVLGWTSTPSGMPAPQELEEDLYLLRAADGENVLVKTSGGGDVKLTTGQVTLELTGDGKVLLGSGAVDVLAVVSDALKALASTTVQTAAGPQPLSSAAKLAALKASLDTIKGA